MFQILDAVGHHVFPAKKDLLFAYDYRGNSTPDGKIITIIIKTIKMLSSIQIVVITVDFIFSLANAKLPPKYFTRHDWEMELSRLKVKGWKAASWNEEFQDSHR